MADGSITKHKNQNTRYLSLGLKKSDIKHIQKFKEFLNASYPIFIRNNRGSVLDSKQLEVTLKKSLKICTKIVQSH